MARGQTIRTSRGQETVPRHCSRRTPAYSRPYSCAVRGTSPYPGKVCHQESGKEAVTTYEVLEAFQGYCLVCCTPKTGRTHQIRVHLSHIKHPIVADDMYGGKLVYPWQLQDSEPAVQDPIIARCALHAWTLAFKHPTTEKMVRFEAPLPDDMQTLLEMLRRCRSTDSTEPHSLE